MEPKSVGVLLRPWLEVSIGALSPGIGLGAVGLVELLHLAHSFE